MTANEYQMEALRTESPWPEMLDDDREDRAAYRLTQGLMGLCGEAGEAIDLLKKYMFQGHDLDAEHVARELGDALWYIAMSADALGYTLEQVMRMNADKLRARYPDGFDAGRSRERAATDV